MSKVGNLSQPLSSLDFLNNNVNEFKHMPWIMNSFMLLKTTPCHAVESVLRCLVISIKFPEAYIFCRTGQSHQHRWFLLSEKVCGFSQVFQIFFFLYAWRSNFSLWKNFFTHLTSLGCIEETGYFPGCATIQPLYAWEEFNSCM